MKQLQQIEQQFKSKYYIICFLITLFFLVVNQSVFSQEFSRDLELKNPTRMNGQDVLSLQKCLLELRFYELGVPDGYYGPMTEKVVKKIQDYFGWSATGIVDKKLWDFIFSFEEETRHHSLPDLQTYHEENLERSKNLGIGIYGSGDYIDEIFVYYALEDKKIKIIESNQGNLSRDMNMLCYFINTNDCRIELSFWGSEDFMEEYGYEEEQKNIYYIIKGVLYREMNDTIVQQNDERGIIDRINTIKNMFHERYR